MKSAFIRLARYADVPVLQALIGSSVRQLNNGSYTTAQVESALKYIFGIDSQLIADGTYFVAEKNNIIAGCGGWSKRQTLYGGDQSKAFIDPLLDPAKDAARIRAFFIHPHFARQGIGKQLLTYSENAAELAGFSYFELGSTLPGVPLYLSMGYSALENIDKVMPDGEILTIIKMIKPACT